MAFLGLVPSEDSSGEKHRRGRLTKMGQCAGPPDSCGGELALPASPARRARHPGAPRKLTGAGDRDRRLRPAAVVPTVSTDARGTQAGAQGSRSPRAGRLHLGRTAAASPSVKRDAPTRRARVAKVTAAHRNESQDRRASSAIRIWIPTRAPLHCTSSRRSTVMRAPGNWSNHRISA